MTMLRSRIGILIVLACPWLAWADWAADRDGSAGYVEVTTLATAVDEAVPFFIIYGSDLPADFHTAMSDAGDTDGKTLRVSTSDGATQIACWPVGVNTSTDTFALFVKGDVISASSDVPHRVYVGNASLSMPAASDTYGRNAVFADYEGFYLPGVTLTDLTGNGRDLTAVNSPGTAASSLEGVLAATYNGSSQYHYYDGTQAVTNWPVTLEAIGYSTSASADQAVFGLFNTGSAFSANLAVLRMRGNLASPTTDPAVMSVYGSSGNISSASSMSGYTASTSHYIAGSRDANTGTTTVYIDGGNSGTNTTTITAPSFNSLAIGVSKVSTPTHYLSGRVAAAILSNSVRSADYVATMNEVWDGTVYSVGSWTAAETCTDGSTGWLLFQTASNTSAGDTAWTDVNNALDDDGDYASVTLSNEDVSDFLTLTNPSGISIPSGATITAVHFRVKRQDVSNGVQDLDIRAVKGGTRVGNNLSVAGAWPATAATQDYGGGLLGTTWSPTDFGTNFGVAIQILDTDIGSDTGRVYVVWTKIDWTCGGDTFLLPVMSEE